MNNVAHIETTSGINVLAAKLSVIAAMISIAALLGLHLLSPEFGPSWRMVSEYANGNYEWVLFVFFTCWGLSSLCLAVALWTYVSSLPAKIGLIFLIVSGLGETLAAFFNVNHPLHGMTGTLGIPTLIIAALLISYNLRRKPEWKESKLLMWSAHSTWMSLVLLVVTMIIMINGFKQAGIELGPGQKPPTSVPNGVIAVVGYANRILIAAYIGWLILIASRLYTSRSYSTTVKS